MTRLAFDADWKIVQSPLRVMELKGEKSALRNTRRSNMNREGSGGISMRSFPIKEVGDRLRAVSRKITRERDHNKVAVSVLRRGSRISVGLFHTRIRSSTSSGDVASCVCSIVGWVHA